MAESENALINASGGEPECQRLLQDGQYVAPMAGLLRFFRPLNCVMSAVGVAIGGGVGVGSAAWGDLAPPLPLAPAAPPPLTPGGNAPHDNVDPAADPLHHPEPPPPPRP